MGSDMKPTPKPAEYQCSCCKATNCRLWRKSHTFLDYIKLLCSICLEAETIKQGNPRKIVSEMSQCSWWVAAVPTPDGSYWGFTSVPQEGCDWWYALPVYPSILRDPNPLIDTTLTLVDLDGKTHEVPVCNIAGVTGVWQRDDQSALDMYAGRAVFLDQTCEKTRAIVDNARKSVSTFGTLGPLRHRG